MEEKLTASAQEMERELADPSETTVNGDTESKYSETSFADGESGVSEKSWKNSENAKNAQRRRESELKRAVREAREAGIIEAIGGKNPYTGNQVKDARDVDEYLLMKEIEEGGGDPLWDFHKFRKEKDRRADQAEAEDARQQEWIDSDRENFVSKYPDVSLNELIDDEGFRAFAEGKTGNMPLADIYAGYQSFIGRFEKQAKNRAAQMYANHRASPGALSSSDTDAVGYYTPEQVRAMSPEEVHENYERIRASMKKWK